ncbi:aminotransferase class I/II-fold pyridoxal phosphate-dependent enzyme [Pedobacter insulae]|uniref:7-keto-8-aminopelargonate synthetase n=1 Tax=Pedobacter insulae TaxID=414048 RepID=A0A1I2XEB5_9SPHI|nr:aminotransferase class I/II-fold pyridoxal phosphate-dependent enzyme [Pedobacter insulae]SFH11016.1 7-keto-8-aminopelargonate synthetase [Pedobacter insulae]
MNEAFKQLLNPLYRQIEMANESYLYFGGTAYLGIPQHQQFQELYIEGIKRFGLNNGTSRNNNVQLGIYHQAEEFAAAYFGANASLITSSGYLSAQLSVKCLSALGEVRYAPATHPALWLHQPPQTVGSFDVWATNLIIEINQSKLNTWVIISNSLNNLYPEQYDFSFIERIDQQKKIILIVDDSHGIGVINNGKGVYATLPKLKNVETVVIASLAKALGVDAGLVLGSGDIISLLKQTNEFLGASPPAAAGLYAFMNATIIYEQELNQLKILTNRLSSALKRENSWSFTSNFPVFLSNTAAIEERLFQKGILMSSFAYPDKDGTLINRIVLSSWHTLADIEELILALAK